MDPYNAGRQAALIKLAIGSNLFRKRLAKGVSGVPIEDAAAVQRAMPQHPPKLQSKMDKLMADMLSDQEVENQALRGFHTARTKKIN